MSEENLQVLLAARPEGLPKESDFKIVRQPMPELTPGKVLVENLYLSLDPAMRGWMADRKSYIPPVGLGEVMRGLTVAEVVRSEDPAFAPGDRVSGTMGWQRYAVARGKEFHRLPDGVSPSLALGPLGMTGLTAYFGLLDVGRPKEGETVLVSAAAGAVGSVVGQIAKIKGCRVVGIAGGPDKCRWLREELGFDAAIDYKSEGDLWEKVRAACPKGIDVYFDNVGGEILNVALRGINRGARVTICGAISQYNATQEVPGPSNYLSLLINRARMEGFIVFDYQAKYGEGLKDLGRWLQEGRLRHRADVVEGLENAPKALLRLFDGGNMGKLLVRIKDGA
jgi:NADPH-dependent curcumin reductase CurA